MKLYFNPHSPACRRVLAVGFHLQLPIELHELPFGDDRHPGIQRVRALSPGGRVPLLEDGSFAIWESNAIMQYLCAKKVEQSLFPEETKTRIEIARWQFWQTAHLGPACDQLADEQVFKRWTGGGEADPKVVEEATEAFRREAKVLDQHLKSRKFIVGDSLTLADYSIGSCLTYWQPAGMPLPEFKHLKDWFTHLETTEAWKKSAGRAR
ncbi:MAG TPA: glutathione S-transferase family protein [Bdellovibrionota bacterium]|nr:glutathione S-transferase family protein [Bdellovibrionota bacterium]